MPKEKPQGLAKARSLLAKSKTPEARALLDEILEREPDHEEASALMVESLKKEVFPVELETWLQRAQGALEEGRVAAAQAIADRILEVNGEHQGALGLLWDISNPDPGEGTLGGQTGPFLSWEEQLGDEVRSLIHQGRLDDAQWRLDEAGVGQAPELLEVQGGLNAAFRRREEEKRQENASADKPTDTLAAEAPPAEDPDGASTASPGPAGDRAPAASSGRTSPASSDSTPAPPTSQAPQGAKGEGAPSPSPSGHETDQGGGGDSPDLAALMARISSLPADAKSTRESRQISRPSPLETPSDTEPRAQASTRTPAAKVSGSGPIHSAPPAEKGEPEKAAAEKAAREHGRATRAAAENLGAEKLAAAELAAERAAAERAAAKKATGSESSRTLPTTPGFTFSAPRPNHARKTGEQKAAASPQPAEPLPPKPGPQPPPPVKPPPRPAASAHPQLADAAALQSDLQPPRRSSPLRWVALLLLLGAAFWGYRALKTTGNRILERGKPQLARVQVSIPAAVRLGCVDNPSSPDCDSDEKAFSSNSVANLQPFEIAATETTWGAYRRCVDAGSCADPLWLKAPPKDHFPVTDIDWESAQRFCRWVGGRLPTEIEWELAARLAEEERAERGSAREIRPYTIGRRVCCAANASIGPSTTQPSVEDSQGSPKISGMLGNVAEWTASVYQETLSLEASEVPASSPAQSVTIRGGSWMHPPEMARVSARQSLPATMSLGTVGFRCVWALAD